MKTGSSNIGILGIACALAGGILWGFSGSCAQYLFGTYALDPIWVMSTRIIIAGVVMMAIAVVVKRKDVLAPLRTWRGVARLISFAVFGLAFTQFTYLMAIDTSNAGTATVLEYIGPVMVVFFVCARDRKAPTWRELVSLGCVVAGTFFLATHGDPTQLVLTPNALIWGLLAAVSMMFYSLIPEPLLAKYDNVTVLAWALLFGGIVMAVWQHPWTNVPAMGLGGWVALVGGLTLAGTVAAFLFYFQAIKLIGPSQTSMLASVEAVSATAFAVLWLGTSFTTMDFIGLVLIVSTVSILASAGFKRPSAKTPPGGSTRVPVMHLKRLRSNRVG